MGWQRRAAAVAVLAVVLSAAACDEPASSPPGASERASEGAAAEAAAGWAAVAEAPLDPRHGANAFWIDGTLLVVGGRDTPACPPGADCIRPAEPPLRDGARYDPATESWAAIAPAPRPVGHARGAVVGQVLYLFVPGFDIGPRTRPEFLAYDAGSDEWERLSLPEGDPEIADLQLVAAGDRVVGVRSSQERRVLPDLVYDPASREWDRLPLDPLAPSYDRSAVWTGERLVLVALEHVPNPGVAGPSLYRAAAFDLVARSWQRLPASKITGYNPTWYWSGDSVVNPSVGSADGGEVNNWGRAYPFGGVLDPAKGTWSDLPPVGDGAAGGYSGIQAGGDEYVVSPEGWVLHVPSMAWARLPRPPGAVDEGAAVAWGDDGLYVWGGVRRGAGDQLVADGWVWRP